MDLKRILTTVIGLPIMVLVFALGNKYVIGIVVLIASIIAMYEYFSVVKKVCKPIKWVGYLSNLIIILSMFLNFENITKILTLAFPIIMLILFLHVIISNMKITFKDVAYTLLGIIYIPLFMVFLELTRVLENGKMLVRICFRNIMGNRYFCIFSWQIFRKAQVQ